MALIRMFAFLSAIVLGACATNETMQVASADAAVETEAATATNETDEAVADGDRIICKRRIVTGSRFTKRVCLTWDQWRMIEAESKDLAAGIQRKGGFSDPHNPNITQDTLNQASKR